MPQIFRRFRSCLIALFNVDFPFSRSTSESVASTDDSALAADDWAAIWVDLERKRLRESGHV